MHVVVSTNRWADIRPALLDNLGTRLELKLNDPVDSDVSRAAASSVPAGVPGRGLTPDGLHVQAALPRLDGRADAEGVATALADLVTEAAARWTGPPAEPIRLLPRLLDPADLPPPSAKGGVPVGIEERRLEPVSVDLLGSDPHFLVFGDAVAGKSSLLRAIAQGLATVHGADEVQIFVADVRCRSQTSRRCPTSLPTRRARRRCRRRRGGSRASFPSGSTGPNGRGHATSSCATTTTSCRGRPAARSRRSPTCSRSGATSACTS